MIVVNPPDIRHQTIYDVTLITPAEEFSKLKVRVLNAQGRKVSSFFRDGFLDQVESNCEVLTRCKLMKTEVETWQLQLMETNDGALTFFVPNMTLVRCIERCGSLPQHIKDEVVASWIAEAI